MAADVERQITRLLFASEDGKNSADTLLPLVYDQLRSLARAKLAREGRPPTLQPTALVHEAYLRVAGKNDPGWNGQGHFFAAAAEAIRRILVDQARRKNRLKRGGNRRIQALDGDVSAIGRWRMGTQHFRQIPVNVL